MRVKSHQKVFGGREELVGRESLRLPGTILRASDHRMSGEGSGRWQRYSLT